MISLANHSPVRTVPICGPVGASLIRPRQSAAPTVSGYIDVGAEKSFLAIWEIIWLRLCDESKHTKSGTTFNFVITSPQPFATTNLTAQVSFTRVILDGGKMADLRQEVTITQATK